MANPQTLDGTKFYLLSGDGATPTEVFTFVCVATDITSTKSTDVEDIMLPDCANPAALATRQSAVRSKSWDISISGIADPLKVAPLKTAYEAGTPKNFQLMHNVTGALGGYKEAGAFLVTEFVESMTDRGLVKFSATLRGQGIPTSTVNP